MANTNEIRKTYTNYEPSIDGKLVYANGNLVYESNATTIAMRTVNPNLLSGIALNDNPAVFSIAGIEGVKGMVFGRFTGNWRYLVAANGVTNYGIKCFEYKSFNPLWGQDLYPRFYHEYQYDKTDISFLTDPTYNGIIAKTDAGINSLIAPVWRDFGHRSRSAQDFPNLDGEYDSLNRAITGYDTQYWDNYFSVGGVKADWIKAAMEAWYIEVIPGIALPQFRTNWKGYDYIAPITDHNVLDTIEVMSVSKTELTASGSHTFMDKEIIEKGFLVSNTNPTPTIGDYSQKVTADSIYRDSINGWTKKITGLSSGVKFFICFYLKFADNTYQYSTETRLYSADFSTNEIVDGVTTLPAFLAPVVTLGIHNNVTINSATLRGSFTPYDNVIEEAGFYYGTMSNPHLNGGTRVIATINSNSCEKIITGLTANTKYYNTFFIKINGVEYFNTAPTTYQISTGAGVDFTTLVDVQLPHVYSGIPFENTSTRVKVRIQMDNDGGSPITQIGVCWGTSPNPTTANSKFIKTPISNDFTHEITGLTPATQYWLRGFATNSKGTAYQSDVISFTTLQAVVNPSLSVSNPTNVLNTSVQLNGAVSSLAGKTATEIGFKYKKSVDSDWTTVICAGVTTIGTINKTVTGLLKNTQYSMKSYLVADATYESSVLNFTTANDTIVAPSVVADAPTMDNTNNVSQRVRILSNGGNIIQEVGVCWDVAPIPTTQTTKTDDYAVVVGDVVDFVGLVEENLYYARPYTLVDDQLFWGDQSSFTFDPILPFVPIFTLGEVLDSTDTTVSVHVTLQALPLPTDEGIVYSLVTIPTDRDLLETDLIVRPNDPDSLNYSLILSGLTPATHYFIRPFALNSEGYSWGDEIEVDTLAVSEGNPAVSITMTKLTENSFDINAELAANGNTIAEKGFLYSTNIQVPTAQYAFKVPVTEGTDTFSKRITQLGTATYYIRGYAKVGNQYYYSPVMYFESILRTGFIIPDFEDPGQIFVYVEPITNEVKKWIHNGKGWVKTQYYEDVTPTYGVLNVND